jgi:hypothetical protein
VPARRYPREHGRHSARREPGVLVEAAITVTLLVLAALFIRPTGAVEPATADPVVDGVSSVAPHYVYPMPTWAPRTPVLDGSLNPQSPWGVTT